MILGSVLLGVSQGRLVLGERPERVIYDTCLDRRQRGALGPLPCSMLLEPGLEEGYVDECLMPLPMGPNQAQSELTT